MEDHVFDHLEHPFSLGDFEARDRTLPGGSGPSQGLLRVFRGQLQGGPGPASGWAGVATGMTSVDPVDDERARHE
ncbi:hypothetical protein ACFFX0_28385 [Citricoccus parietis]|uniref:Uncharacterized protein n=1 Tax=Citricoccus parietis TaxID=592307 RepID=A0ABV5G5S2_9MICC